MINEGRRLSESEPTRSGTGYWPGLTSRTGLDQNLVLGQISRFGRKVGVTDGGHAGRAVLHTVRQVRDEANSNRFCSEPMLS